MNSNNLQKFHLTYYKLSENEYINTATLPQYFVPKIINTTSAYFIQANHLIYYYISPSINTTIS